MTRNYPVMPKTAREWKLAEPHRLPPGQERIYIAKSGIVVITCWNTLGEDDFKSDLHAAAWSYLNWGRKILVPSSWRRTNRAIKYLQRLTYTTSPGK